MSGSRSEPDAAPVTAYFDGLADLYAACRPSYPREAIGAALEGLGRRPRVIDVGCGTGICSRLLAESGAAVIALDPNADMLESATMQGPDGTPAIEYRQAKAEATGLEDNVADMVLCAQAFHWFDAPVALKEFHRILRPAGRLALLWNVRDKTTPFNQGYEDIIERAQATAQEQGRVLRRNRSYSPDHGGFFTNVRVQSFENPQQLDREGLLGRAQSASYFPREGPIRDELEAALRDLFRGHEQNGLVTLRQKAELTLAGATTDRSG